MNKLLKHQLDAYCDKHTCDSCSILKESKKLGLTCYTWASVEPKKCLEVIQRG